VRFSPPPNWPTPPPGWRPPPDWRPDPSWPPPPDGWRLWTDDVSTPAASTPIGRLPAAPPASSPLEHAPLPAQKFSGYRFNVLTEWLPTVMNLLRRIRCTAASMGFGYIRRRWTSKARHSSATSLGRNRDRLHAQAHKSADPRCAGSYARLEPGEPCPCPACGARVRHVGASRCS
jgi:hypothetical protein